MMSSDTVGSLECQVWEIIGPANGMNKYHKIFFESKQAGELRLETNFEPQQLENAATQAQT
mgnify:FL=1